jgi:hypothetical protein
MHHLRFTTPCLLALALSGAASCMAQSAPADTAAPAAARAGTEQRIERIQIEDAGSRIDELRVGGETQSIVVSPKGGMPAYDVLPGSTNRNLTRGERGNGAANGGTRVWKLLDF